MNNLKKVTFLADEEHFKEFKNKHSNISERLRELIMEDLGYAGEIDELETKRQEAYAMASKYDEIIEHKKNEKEERLSKRGNKEERMEKALITLYGIYERTGEITETAFGHNAKQYGIDSTELKLEFADYVKMTENDEGEEIEIGKESV